MAVSNTVLGTLHARLSQVFNQRLGSLSQAESIPSTVMGYSGPVVLAIPRDQHEDKSFQ